ncbi:MAG: transglutaminase family protein [Vulcanimicrobiaceae bacterium]
MELRSVAQPLPGAPLDEKGIRWSAVSEATYLIEQEFRYEYPGPISDLRHRLVIVPRQRHGDQRRLAHQLDVSPNVPARAAADAFGNPVVMVSAPVVHESIAFGLRTVLRRRFSADLPPISAAMLREPLLLAPTRLTRPDAALLEAAGELRLQHRDPLELAHAVNAFVHAEMRYDQDSTDVRTTAAEAFSQRSGVCQDYAHVMLALARSCGIAARYVSGHLIGEGATHAWVELIVPEGSRAVVAALDPTHGRAVTLKYVVVAVGRDYDDVAPTSGSFCGPGGQLSSRRRVAVTGIRYAA